MTSPVSPATTSDTGATLARPRMRGFPVFAATLHESRSLLAAACGYILIIGLLVGLLLPAFETLKIEVYLTGSLGALIGGATLSPPETAHFSRSKSSVFHVNIMLPNSPFEVFVRPSCTMVLSSVGVPKARMPLPGLACVELPTIVRLLSVLALPVVALNMSMPPP